MAFRVFCILCMFLVFSIFAFKGGIDLISASILNGIACGTVVVASKEAAFNIKTTKRAALVTLICSLVVFLIGSTIQNYI